MNSGGGRGDIQVTYQDVKNSCEELFPEKNEAWVMSIYRELVDVKPKSGTSLNKMIDYTLDLIIGTDRVDVKNIYLTARILSGTVSTPSLS